MTQTAGKWLTQAEAASIKTRRRAAGQPSRADHEDGELARDHWHEV